MFIRQVQGQLDVHEAELPQKMPEPPESIHVTSCPSRLDEGGNLYRMLVHSKLHLKIVDYFNDRPPTSLESSAT